MKARETTTGTKWDLAGTYTSLQPFLEAFTQHILAGDHIRVAEGVGELKLPKDPVEPPA